MKPDFLAARAKSDAIQSRWTAMVFAAVALGSAVTNTQAAFMIVAPNPGGLKFFIDGANKDVTGFCGTVGVNTNCTSGASSIEVNVTTNVAVDTGNGYANIKPASEEFLLTTLTFVPENPAVFGDFSLRGQLVADSSISNPLRITVTDLLGPTYIFDYTGIDSTGDFERIGVVYSPSTSTSTIKSVEVYFASGFKEVKQIDFSYNPNSGEIPVPEPATLALFGLGFAGMSWRRRRAV